MRTEYKVLKPFGCAQKRDTFKLDIEEYNSSKTIEYKMEMTYDSKNSKHTRSMSISGEEYINYLVKEGYLQPYGIELTQEGKDTNISDNSDEQLPSIEELKLLTLELFLDDCANKYRSNLNKIQDDYNEGKVQTCVKVESETVNYNLLKLITAIKQILDVDKNDK